MNFSDITEGACFLHCPQLSLNWLSLQAARVRASKQKCSVFSLGLATRGSQALQKTNIAFILAPVQNKYVSIDQESNPGPWAFSKNDPSTNVHVRRVRAGKVSLRQ
jgi:hypothetical protein